MIPRERVLAACRRERPERVPMQLRFTPPLARALCEKTGADDLDEHFRLDMRDMRMDHLWEPGRDHGRVEMFLAYHAERGEGFFVDDWWGVGYTPGSTHHFVHQVHPMQNFGRLDEFERYPFPDELPDRAAPAAREEVAAIQARDLAAIGRMEMTVFEVAWALRGMEQLFVDFAENPELAEHLLDRITAIRCRMARHFAEAGCDVLALGDDVGTQHGLLMSRDMWRRWLKPRLAKVIRSARDVRGDIAVRYHSDGDIGEVIDELIEVGVTVLNPLQPECVDPAAIKKRYGDRLAFWGCIGTQTTMPFGSPEDVRSAVKSIIDTIGCDGGLVIAPSHVLEPEVPLENVFAFAEAVEEFGGCAGDARDRGGPSG